jgi:ATP-binding cassette, subfamily A (ABC1), member 3
MPRVIRGRKLQLDQEHELHAIAQDVEEEKKRVEEGGSQSDHLRVLQLTKQFGNNVAVDNISFGIGPGIFALLGPNGAGKSTTINMIRGEVVPDHGTVLLEGKNILTDVRAGRKLLGGRIWWLRVACAPAYKALVCPQFDALDLLTTKEHLQFYARAKGIATVEQDVETVISKVELTGYEDRLASKLSGGNKRKLSLAIALLGKASHFIQSLPTHCDQAIRQF